MNTVEALKKFYKTMTGNDWPYDPNPTDAEVIDKIAADGSAGGGGSDGGGSSAPRVIYVNKLQESSFGDAYDESDPSTWTFDTAYYLGKDLTVADIAGMIPGNLTIKSSGMQSVTVGQDYEMTVKELTHPDNGLYCISVQIYFGSDSEIEVLAYYYPSLGYMAAYEGEG